MGKGTQGLALVGMGSKNAPISFRDFLKRNERECSLELRSTMGLQTIEKGAALVSSGFLAGFEIALKNSSPIRASATVIRRETGETYHIVTSDDTSNEGILVVEGEDQTDATEVQFGMKSLPWRKYSSGRVIVSGELVEDGGTLFETALAEILAGRIARRQNRDLTELLLQDSPTGKTALSSSAVSYEDLIDLICSVDSAYRVNASFQMNDSTYSALRKLSSGGNSDSVKLPFLQGGEGREPLLLGYPVRINPHLPNIGTGKKSILFGDFSRVIIRDVKELSIKRIMEQYRPNDQEAFIGYLRSGAALMSQTAIKALSHP